MGYKFFFGDMSRGEERYYVEGLDQNYFRNSYCRFGHLQFSMWEKFIEETFSENHHATMNLDNVF